MDAFSFTFLTSPCQAQAREDLRQPRGQQPRQDAAQHLAAVLVEVPLQAYVQLLAVQARLEVQRHVRIGDVLRQMAAHRQRQGAGNAEVGEEHLAQLGVKGLLALLQRQGDVAQ